MGRWIIPTIFLIALQSPAEEKAESFIIRIHNDRIRVLSPPSHHPRINVIVENKSLIRTTGKLTQEDGQVLSYLSCEPGKDISLSSGLRPNQTLYFVPLSPPFQRMALKIGSHPYEIPTKK